MCDSIQFDSLFVVDTETQQHKRVGEDQFSDLEKQYPNAQFYSLCRTSNNSNIEVASGRSYGNIPSCIRELVSSHY